MVRLRLFQFLLFYTLVRSNAAPFQIQLSFYNQNGHNAQIIRNTRVLPGNLQLLHYTTHLSPGKALFVSILVVLCIS